jgi:hypothetical protein
MDNSGPKKHFVGNPEDIMVPSGKLKALMEAQLEAAVEPVSPPAEDLYPESTRGQMELHQHPWKDLAPGSGKTYMADLNWAYNNAVKILRRGDKGVVRFYWRGASGAPPSNGALTCLGWAAAAPVKFFEACKALFSKSEGDEETAAAVKEELKTVEQLRKDVLEKLEQEEKKEKDPYFFDEGK